MTAPESVWPPTLAAFSSTHTDRGGVELLHADGPPARPAGPGTDDQHVVLHDIAFDHARKFSCLARDPVRQCAQGWPCVKPRCSRPCRALRRSWCRQSRCQFDLDVTWSGQQCSRGQRPRAYREWQRGTTGMPAFAATTNAPLRKRSNPGSRSNVPSGKKAIAPPAAAFLQQSPCVAGTPLAATIHVMGADPSQQQVRERHLAHLALDHETEHRRQRGRTARCRRDNWSDWRPPRRRRLAGVPDAALPDACRKTRSATLAAVRTILRRRACHGTGRTSTSAASASSVKAVNA